MKREAFWSKREIKDNQAKWDGHLETYELGRNGCATICKCLGCVLDGEETNFLPSSVVMYYVPDIR